MKYFKKKELRETKKTDYMGEKTTQRGINVTQRNTTWFQLLSQ